MFEKHNKPEQSQTQGHERLSTSDLAGPRTERLDAEEPITESDVTITEAYNLRSEPIDEAPRENRGPGQAVSTQASMPSSSRGSTGSYVSGPGTAAAAAPAREKEEAAPLFSPEEAQGFRTRWDGIQTGFVDEPRRSVEQADNLVAETMKRLAEVFANERERLEKEWDRGGDVSTEDLRQALRRYRSFFGRLLAI